MNATDEHGTLFRNSVPHMHTGRSMSCRFQNQRSAVAVKNPRLTHDSAQRTCASVRESSLPRHFPHLKAAAHPFTEITRSLFPRPRTRHAYHAGSWPTFVSVDDPPILEVATKCGALGRGICNESISRGRKFRPQLQETVLSAACLAHSLVCEC